MNGPAGMRKVADRVWSLPLDAGSIRIAHTQCYLLADDAGRVHVIDPGERTDANWAALLGALAAIGHDIGDVATVIVTHYHHDHLGGATRLRAESGAPLAMTEVEQHGIRYSANPPPSHPELDRWGVPLEWRDRLATAWHRVTPVEADLLLSDGDLLDAPGRRLRISRTPGHTEGHLNIFDEDARLLFTGDHVLPTLTPGFGERIALDEHPLTAYLGALQRTSRLDVTLVLPGHGDPFTRLAERCARIADRHVSRNADIARSVDDEGPGTPWQIASRLQWSGGWDQLTDSVRRSALSQVELHLELIA